MSTLKVNNIQNANGTSAIAIDSSGVATFSKTLVPANPLTNRNLIINGDMQIAQRGNSSTGISSTGTDYYTVDRFRFGGTTYGTWTMTQDTDVPSGQGFANSMKLACTTANASLSADSNITVQHRIEGQMLQHLKKGTANAESLTLSFWVKSNKTGTYVIEFRDVDNTRIICQSYTINAADTWEKKTITFDGDTTGAFDNDNDDSFRLLFFFAAGTNYTSGTLQTSWASAVEANRAVGQVNLADSTSNYINITGVQLEVGDAATPFEHRPYDMELARCQRYCEVYEWGGASPSGHSLLANVWSASTRAKTTGIELKVVKRAAPTITISGSGRYIATTGQHSASGFYTTYINEDRIGVNSNNTYAVGHGWMDSFQNVTIDAEL